LQKIVSKFSPCLSNNKAEYEALLHGLQLAITLGIKRLLVYGDSLLVVQQVNKDWDINKETMDAHIAEIRKLENKFSRLEIHHVVRDNNMTADILSKLDSDRAEVPTGILVHELHHPSINTSTPMEVDSGPTETSREVMMIEAVWHTMFIDYIKDKVLPPGIKKDDTKAVRIMHRSKNYVLVDSELYKRGAGSGILMKCVTAEEGKEILQEAHEGTCGNHVASRMLVGKAFGSGFYWPIALSDAEVLVKHCLGCQYFAKQSHLPAI
jgi:hypothetical protein